MNSVSTATNGCLERRSTSAFRSSDLVIRGWIRMSLARPIAPPSRVDKRGVEREARAKHDNPSSRPCAEAACLSENERGGGSRIGSGTTLAENETDARLPHPYLRRAAR